MRLGEEGIKEYSIYMCLSRDRQQAQKKPQALGSSDEDGEKEGPETNYATPHLHKHDRVSEQRKQRRGEERRGEKRKMYKDHAMNGKFK
jgi:hypothetical protein